MIALGISTGLVVGLVVGLGILSLSIGAFEKIFGKAKLKVLKSSKDGEYFSFALQWNSAKEPAAIDTLRLRLFNPFGKPTQVEVSRKFDKEKDSFAREVHLGEDFPKLLNANGMEKGSVQVELASSKDGVFFQFDYLGEKFKKLLGDANKTVSDLAGAEKKPAGVNVKIPVRSFIADTVPGKGAQLAIASNPAFEAYFSNTGGSVEGSKEEVRENFNIAKVWIEDGCIVCNACEDIYPEVFDVTEDNCVIRPSPPLDNGLLVEEAAEACPVEIIKFTVA